MISERFRVTAWPGWPVTPPAVPVQVAEADGDLVRFRYGRDDEYRYEQVPDEIRLRELADLDVTDVEAIADFTSTYGRLTPFGDLLDDVGMTRGDYQRFFAETAARNGRNPAHSASWDWDASTDSGRPVLWVHADDIALRLRILKQLTAHAVAHVAGEYEHKVWPECRDEGEAWRRFTLFTNAALREFHVRVYVNLGDPEFDIGASRPSVYQVAILQLLNDLTDGVDYHTCMNETCGRIFVRQRGLEEGAFKRTKGVSFCTRSCANSQRQRDFRRRKRGQEQAT
jgi:hypothetical protein